MLRDDVRELRREVAEARQAAQDAWPVLPDSQSSGDPETFRLIEGTVNEASGVTAGATFDIDNVRPLAGGLNPAASTADGVNIEVEQAAGNYTDNQTKIRAAYDEDNSRWIDVTDQSGDQSPQTYNVKLQAAKYYAGGSVSVRLLEDDLTTESGSAFLAYDPHNQFSTGRHSAQNGRIALVTDPDTGAERWELTHVEGLALWIHGTLASDESSGTATTTSYVSRGVPWNKEPPTGTITLNGVPAGALTGDPFVAYVDDGEADPWEYRVMGDGAPAQTYNVKVQEAKAYTDDHVSVKWLEDDLATEVGSAFDVYDPHNQFSTGGLDDVFGRITRVTDADTGAARWELTHLEGLALTAYGTLAENEGATTSGKASSSSYSTEGIAWHESAPSGSINIVGLDGQQSGDIYVAVLSDPDASPPEYRAVKVPDQNTDVFAKVNASESAAGYLEDQLVNTGTLTAGYQRVYRRVAGDDDTIYFETEEASGSGDTVSWVAPDGAALVHMGNADADLYVWDDSGNEFVFSAGSKTLYNFTGRVLSSDIPVPSIEVETDVYVAIDNTSASVVTGTASGASNASNGFTAIAATSLTGWNGEVSFSISASTLLNPLGLEVNSGDTIMAVGDYNGTAARWAIVNVESAATPIGAIEPVSIILDVPARSGAVAGSAASSGDIYAMCNAANVGQSGIVINGRTYDFTSASLGELIEPNTPVTVRLFNHSLNVVEAPASGLLFCDAKKIGDGGAQEEYQIVSPPELRTLTGFDGDGTADQVITHVDGDIEWEDTGACS